MSKTTKNWDNSYPFCDIERPPFCAHFLPATSKKGMPVAMLWRHCAHAILHDVMRVRFLTKMCVWSQFLFIYIVHKSITTAEFEPYSFEPMRNNSSSEDVTSEGEAPRRGNKKATRKGMCMFRPGDRWSCEQNFRWNFLFKRFKKILDSLRSDSVVCC